MVTGAGGFVGGTVIEALFFGGSYNIRAGIARWSSAPRIARLPITLTQCDILKPHEIAEAFAGTDYVIHCAVGDDNVSIDGTRNVLRAAANAGVRRVVHISSVAVYGGATGIIDEQTEAPEGTLTPYGAAKLAAESICREYDNVVIIRPTIIYGPFSARWIMLNGARLRSGRWKHLGVLGLGKCNLVHAHDVVQFALAALHKDEAVGQVFNINGPEIVTWNYYFEAFNQYLGMPPLIEQSNSRAKLMVRALAPVRDIGKYALKHHATQLQWLARKSKTLKRIMQDAESTLKYTPNQDELTLYGLDATYLTTKAERIFGFQSAVGVDDGLAMSALWLRHMGEVV
jgi:nucleoside-diphosphate-sugar epimerase